MLPKKKILIIGPGMEIGGVERSLQGLLDGIDYNKYDVDLFLYAHTGELMPYINSNVNLLPENKLYRLMTEPIASLFISGHFYVGFVRLYTKVYGKIRSKLLHTGNAGIFICRKILTKHIKSLNEEYDFALSFFQPHFFVEEKVKANIKFGWVHTDYGNVNEKPDTKYVTKMWKRLDKIACVSEQVKESFDMVFPTLKDKTFVAENILSAEFVRKQADEFDVSNEMPKNDGVVNVLSVGRFCTAKNFDIIPEVCSMMSKCDNIIKWYLIGYGPDEELIKRKIADCEMEEQVIVLGKKTNPYPYMKTCDIYVQPSRYEGKAVTVREAQMLHKPVMITRFATSGSQVSEGVDGFICEMGVQGICDGLKHLIEDSELRDKIIKGTYDNDYGNLEEVGKLFKFAETVKEQHEDRILPTKRGEENAKG